MRSINSRWPAWFVALINEYKFHYPASDMVDDPVVCWHTIPPHGYIWHPGATVILGSRMPLPDKPPAEETASDANETPAGGEQALAERSGEAEGNTTAEQFPMVERVFESLYQYRLSDLLREGYRVEPLGGRMAHFERRPTARLTLDAPPSRRPFAQLGFDIELEDY